MRWMLSLLFIIPSSAHAQGAEELALVKEVFAELQLKSFRWNREFCGYIGFDDTGALVATKPAPGKRFKCFAEEPEELEIIVSSYHTHAAAAHSFYDEVPSGADMESDEERGIDGWVATPGGRLWYIDTEDMVASQICGVGCLPMDAEYIEGELGLIAESYTYEELVKQINEFDDD